MSKKHIILLVVCLLLLAFLGCSKQATAPEYPAKPITIIVPFAAGGSMDIMARAMEKVAIKHLGQPLVVTNVPGGAGTIGWNVLAGSQPDGYSLGVAANGVLLQPLYSQTRYHYPTALEPLAQIVSTPIVVAVLADQPWENINDLVKYAKQHPGELKYSHSALGGAPHVVGEMFTRKAGIDIAQVPFRGESEALAALLGGHVQVLFATAAIKEYVNSGKIRVLAIAEKQRPVDPTFKTVPTFREQGLNVEFSFWQGIAAPKGLPKNIKNRLATGIKGMVSDPEFIDSMARAGMTVEYLGPQNFSDKWMADSVMLTAVVKDTGIVGRISSQKN